MSNVTTARLWLAHLAIVESDYHSGDGEPVYHPLGVNHHVRPSESESTRLHQLAKQATADALLPIAGDKRRRAARDAADAAWWRKK